MSYIIELNISKLNNSTQRLSQVEFLQLIRAAFSCLRGDSITEVFLVRFFLLMDRAGSGVIGFEQLLHWIKDFLAVVNYEGGEYYLEEDDADKSAGKNSISGGVEVQSTLSTSSISSPSIKGLQFSGSPSRSRDNSRNVSPSPHHVTQPKIEPATTTTERNAKRFEIQETSK